MRFPGISCCGVAFIVAGTVSLAVVFSFPVEGRLAGEALQVSRRLQGMNGESSPEASVVKECPVKNPPEGPASRIDLTPTKGVPVEFRCGGSSSLRPDANASPTGKVYEYDVSQNSCTSKSEVTLATEFEGATLTLKSAEGGSVAGPNQVYIFTYTVEPKVDKHLCYTCNTTVSAGAGKKADLPPGEPTPQETVACTVYIKVSKKEEENTTTTSTTAPGTTSGAHAMPLTTVTAIGVLLAVVLRS